MHDSRMILSISRFLGESGCQSPPPAGAPAQPVLHCIALWIRISVIEFEVSLSIRSLSGRASLASIPHLGDLALKKMLQIWLTELLFEIRKECGVVKNITGKCPGVADTFKHSSSAGDEIVCQSAIVNALKKMRIRTIPIQQFDQAMSQLNF